VHSATVANASDECRGGRHVKKIEQKTGESTPRAESKRTHTAWANKAATQNDMGADLDESPGHANEVEAFD
jgi:hypothetical protein